MLFKDLAEALHLTQIMPGGALTLKSFGTFENAAFCVHMRLSQAIYLSGVFE